MAFARKCHEFSTCGCGKSLTSAWIEEGLLQLPSALLQMRNGYPHVQHMHANVAPLASARISLAVAIRMAYPSGGKTLQLRNRHSGFDARFVHHGSGFARPGASLHLMVIED